jgi:Adenosine deaminase
MKRIIPILILVLVLGMVSISGCTSSDNTPTSINDSNSPYAATSEPASTSSVNTSTTHTNPTSKAQSSSADYSDSSSSSSTSSADSGSYVANANTGVFHYSWCHYVNRMKDSNKVYFSSAKAAEDAGYRPCKVCNP